jgi:hypothetical protein
LRENGPATLSFSPQKEEAEENAADLMMRWFAVQDSRAVEVDEPVNHTYRDQHLIAV